MDTLCQFQTDPGDIFSLVPGWSFLFLFKGVAVFTSYLSFSFNNMHSFFLKKTSKFQDISLKSISLTINIMQSTQVTSCIWTAFIFPWLDNYSFILRVPSCRVSEKAKNIDKFFFLSGILWSPIQRHRRKGIFTNSLHDFLSLSPKFIKKKNRVNSLVSLIHLSHYNFR